MRFPIKNHSYSVVKIWGISNIVVSIIGIWLHYGKDAGQYSLIFGTIGITCGVIQILASNDNFRIKNAIEAPNI